MNSDSQGSLEEQDDEEASKLEAKKLIFDGLDIVKQSGQNPNSREEERIRMDVQVTEDQQDGYKKTEGMQREILALATESLDEVDSGEEDFYDAKRDEEQQNDGEDKGGSLNGSESEEEEYTGGSMSLDTNDQEEEDTSLLGSMQAELDALIWENQEEKDLQSKRQKGYRMHSNPKSFKNQIFNKAGPKFDTMIAKYSEVLNEMDSMARGKERDTNKFSDTLLKLLQSDVGSEDVLRMANKADKVREYWEQRNRNDILYTNEKRTAILEGLAAGRENDIDDNNPSHNNQARKTNSEDNLIGSRAQND
jgi:hypothetical protein